MELPMTSPRKPSGLLPALRTLHLRRFVVLVLDGGIAAGSLWLSMFLRFDGGDIPAEYRRLMPAFFALLIAARLSSTLLFRLHRWSFRFSGLTDGARLGMVGLLGTGLFMVGVYLVELDKGPPRSVILMELLVTISLMALMRFSPRLHWIFQADRERSRRQDALSALIVGAGAAGEMLLRDLQRSRDHGYQILGFIDDDESKWGTIVGGRPILGGTHALPDLVRRHDVGKVLIAIPNLSAERVRELLNLCADLQVRIKILPYSHVDLHEKISSAMLQDLSPEDLLNREPIVFNDRMGDSPIAGRVTLVTGGAGSIGSEICRQLLLGGASRLVMVDVNENGLYLNQRRLQRDFPRAVIETQVGSVRDDARMSALFEQHRPQDVFHAAAHKHVPLMEEAPCEAVKNNVLGTLNVARAAGACGAERFVFISTDKAVRPSSVMGATKRIGELLIRQLADSSTTYFCAVRFGNVLDSAGSVVPLFREQIAAGGPVTVTDPQVRRYFMTVPEAVGLVLKAAYEEHGHLCVLEMGEQIRILDLARHMITMSGLAPDIDIPIIFTGLRPGEKLAEELLTEEEERTFRSAEKILVAKGPAPPADLLRGVEELIRRAFMEDHDGVVAQLRSLVPTFRRPVLVPVDSTKSQAGVVVRVADELSRSARA
jgi:FlaA1/EpsC-like NDP-sugar epimerase